jgi:hypothetical protein
MVFEDFNRDGLVVSNSLVGHEQASECDQSQLQSLPHIYRLGAIDEAGAEL